MTQRLKNLLSNTNTQLGYPHFDAMLVIAVLGYFALALADMAGLKG